MIPGESQNPQVSAEKRGANLGHATCDIYRAGEDRRIPIESGGRGSLRTKRWLMMNSPIFSSIFEFHVARAARERYQFSETLFAFNGNVVFANVAGCREFAQRMNLVRQAESHPDLAVNPGALHAMGLIDEAMHLVFALYRQQRDPGVMADALAWFEQRLGAEDLDKTLLRFCEEFPATTVYRGERTAAEWMLESTGRVAHRAVALEEMILLWLANLNPGFKPFGELFADAALAQSSAYRQITSQLRDYFATRPGFGPEQQNLVDMLRAPAMASPDSLAGQLAFIQTRWFALIGSFIQRLLIAMDVLKEEEVAVWMRFHPPDQAVRRHDMAQAFGDSSMAAIPSFSDTLHEYEHFSPDVDWMPKTVLMAKSTYVWLHQLAQEYGRQVTRLDQVPDEELDRLARRGFNSLWLIGIWERSRASQRIKQLTGNPEAAASAYSLYDYRIADDLGGEAAYANLKDRAARRGLRLASDMVPNHMGIDSPWVIEHPDWFVSLPCSPFPAYRFDGPDVSSQPGVEIKIEDHYYDRTDASVVFRRVDHSQGDTRYIYHGNDGTSFPWNDTAQLNYLKAEVREAVIQTILQVARRFPIIRFDAAMTLTKRHFQRLWFPAPGTGGAIPSRAEHGLTKADFDAAMPHEFWREVVDRVAQEVPGTLLLAEAFWLLEGYFVRTLGMHRVYNSAFMNMLRDEENANYRSVLKNTLEFDPEVLKRYVNFMNNPDERTSVDQFGKGDKYFGICTLLATLPGLPMFGHGQIEGLTERYGMEYRRAYYDEQPDPWLVARHEREISPLLHRRGLFAEVRDFLLYDFYADDGRVNENVFAYSNRLGKEHALVVYNNRYDSTRGWIRQSVAYAEKHDDGERRLRQRSLSETLGLRDDTRLFAACRDALTGLEHLYRATDLVHQGLQVELGAYKCQVLLDWREIYADGNRPWGLLCDQLGGRGISSLQDALEQLELQPVHDALREVLDVSLTATLAQLASEHGLESKRSAALHAEEVSKLLTEAGQRVQLLVEAVERHTGVSRAAEATSQLEAPRDAAWTVRHFKQLLSAAIALPRLEPLFSQPWTEAACAVLPSPRKAIEEVTPIWASLIGWAVLAALGERFDSVDPEAAASRLFERLRLRQPMAEAFAAAGMTEERSWRAAAMVRASFTHAQFGAEPTAITGKKAAAPFNWLHDPDVAWLLGVHEYQGVRYFDQGSFERLTWWMSLPDLLNAVAKRQEPEPRETPEPDSRLQEEVIASQEREAQEHTTSLLAAIEARIKSRTRAAALAGYRVEALLFGSAE